jgi:hypothetical protein
MSSSIYTVIFVFASCTASIVHDAIDVLEYETDTSTDTPAHTLASQVNEKINGMNVEIFGQGSGYKGFGSKFSAALPHLRSRNPDRLVVLADSRDVLINNPYNDERYATSLLDEFTVAFEHLTVEHPDAIVISAEAQCCVSALTYVQPGDYFTADGRRNQLACSSGETNCLWNGDVHAEPWESFMKERMIQHAKGSTQYDDMYLNAGLMAGKAKSLIRVIEAAQIGDKEDDQAVLTDYMYRYPDEIVLDYEQILFGNNRGAVAGLSKEEQCVFRTVEGESRLFHAITKTTPLFIHSPGGFYECHAALAHVLSVPVVKRERKLQFCNYMNCSEIPGSTSNSTLSDLVKLLRGG